MRLKVGLFSDSFPPAIDGVSNVVNNYARIIQEHYGEAVVAAPKYDNVEDNYCYDVIRYQSIKLKEKFSYRAGNPYDIKSLKKLEKKDLDIIHVHSPFASSILAKMLLIGKKKFPIVFTYHTKYDIDFEERIDVPVFRKIATDFIMANINSSDEVWVVSEGAGESLRSIGYEGEYRVMENGTDFPRGQAEPSEIQAMRQKYGINQDDLVFLFVGRMMWYKNCRLILDSLSILKDQGLPFRMFMVGDGFERDEIEAYSQKIGLGDRVIFTGAVQDRNALRAYYSMSDLFIFPSTFDTSGLVVKEAAACDCPSLLLAGTCASEGVKDRFSGFIAKEETPACCAERIARAISDREKLREIGHNAGQHVYLSWEDSVGRAYHRYEEILSEWQPKKNRWFMDVR